MEFETHCMSFPCTELLLFNYAEVNSIFNSRAPLKNDFEWIQWLISLLDESVFLNKSFEWMIQWQIQFSTVTCRHLVAYDVTDTTVIWSAKLVSNVICAILIAIVHKFLTLKFFQYFLSGSARQHKHRYEWFCQRFNRHSWITVK